MNSEVSILSLNYIGLLIQPYQSFDLNINSLIIFRLDMLANKFTIRSPRNKLLISYQDHSSEYPKFWSNVSTKDDNSINMVKVKLNWVETTLFVNSISAGQRLRIFNTLEPPNFAQKRNSRTLPKVIFKHGIGKPKRPKRTINLFFLICPKWI